MIEHTNFRDLLARWQRSEFQRAGVYFYGISGWVLISDMNLGPDPTQIVTKLGNGHTLRRHGSSMTRIRIGLV